MRIPCARSVQAWAIHQGIAINVTLRIAPGLKPLSRTATAHRSTSRAPRSCRRLRMAWNERAHARPAKAKHPSGAASERTAPREFLSVCLPQNEGAKLSSRVMNEPRNRSVADLYRPLLCHRLDFVSYKDRKLVAAKLKGIYDAIDAAAGEAALGASRAGLWPLPGHRPKLSAFLEPGVPFYGFPADVHQYGIPLLLSRH